MRSIDTLDPNAICVILDFLSPTWIINLWLTGDCNLHSLLSKEGSIMSLTLKGPTSILSTSRLPGMIASLSSLTSLSISSPLLRIAHPRRVWNCLSQLSKLRSLCLEFESCDAWMFDVDQLNSLPASRSQSKSSNRLPIATIRPLATTFPHLESLTMSNYLGKTLFSNEHLSALPPSLTSLTVYNFRQIDQKCLLKTASLPHLATLVFDGAICGVLKDPLPSSITSLALTRASEVQVLPSFWSNSRIIELDLDLQLSSLAHLPPSIEKLKIFRFEQLKSATSYLAHLPNLKSFEVTAESNGRVPLAHRCEYVALLRILEIYDANFDSRFDA